MQDEDRRFGGDGVDFIERGHAPFGELKLAPAADDADPLAGRCPLRLLFQHAQGVREGGNAVPAKLQIVAEAAADDMHVGIIQAGDEASAFEVDRLSVRAAFVTFSVVHADDATILDRDVLRVGMLGIERGDLAVVQNQVCLFLSCCHNLSSEGDAHRDGASFFKTRRGGGLFFFVFCLVWCVGFGFLKKGKWGPGGVC